MERVACKLIKREHNDTHEPYTVHARHPNHNRERREREKKFVASAVDCLSPCWQFFLWCQSDGSLFPHVHHHNHKRDSPRHREKIVDTIAELLSLYCCRRRSILLYFPLWTLPPFPVTLPLVIIRFHLVHFAHHRCVCVCVYSF